MGAALLAGARLARRRRYRAHAWCQSAIVVANLGVIALTMVPSLRAQVVPKLPLGLGKTYYALAAAHAALGTVAELVGLYVMLSAGTSLLPKRLRISEYRLWMRGALALWWAVLVLGTATYARWYVPSLFSR